MNPTDKPPFFQREIYDGLDEKLRESPFQSGISEAHGLLAGLACRGIPLAQIGNKMYLMKLDSEAHKILISGLYELIVRDLDSTEPIFNLLLLDAESSLTLRIDGLANWCGGYMQGFCHDSEGIILQCSADVQEILRDVMSISGLDIDPLAGDARRGLQSAENEIADENEHDQSLFEIEEYLKIGIQLIYDELVDVESAGKIAANSSAAQIH